MSGALKLGYSFEFESRVATWTFLGGVWVNVHLRPGETPRFVHGSLSWIFDLIWTIPVIRVCKVSRSYQRGIMTSNGGVVGDESSVCAYMCTHAENANGRDSSASSESYEHSRGESKSIRSTLMRSRRPHQKVKGRHADAIFGKLGRDPDLGPLFFLWSGDHLDNPAYCQLLFLQNFLTSSLSARHGDMGLGPRFRRALELNKAPPPKRFIA